ncbi:MAG: hypothetical protein ACRDBG_09810 [Waterburya sp.]
MNYRECCYCGLDFDDMAHDLRYIGFKNRDLFAHWQCIEKEESTMRTFLSVEKLIEHANGIFRALPTKSPFDMQPEDYNGLASGLLYTESGQ